MPDEILIDASTVVFPLLCQKCGETAAMPFMAGTSVKSDGIRVAVRCRECRHEWAFDMTTKSPFRGPQNSQA